MEGRAVAHAGGHRDHRAVHQAAHHAGQRALHARDRHHAPRVHQFVHIGQQPVNARHAHVVQTHHAAAQGLGGDRRLLRHGDVAGSAGADHHVARAVRLRHRPRDADAADRAVVQRMAAHHDFGLLRIQSGDQRGALARGLHAVQDAADLLGGLALAVDHLGRALAQRAVVVHLGVTDVRKGLGFERVQRLLGRKLPRLHPFEKLQCFLLFHFMPFSGDRPDARFLSLLYHKFRKIANPPARAGFL